MDMLKVAFDVHGCPGEDVHTRSQLVLQVFQVGDEEGLGVRANLVHDTVVFAKNEGKLVVISLELFFLKEDDLGALRDLNTDTREAFGLTNQRYDLRVEVHVQLVVVRVANNQCSKKTSLGLFDFNDPSLPPFVLEVEEGIGDAVVGLHLSHSPLGLIRA